MYNNHRNGPLHLVLGETVNQCQNSELDETCTTFQSKLDSLTVPVGKAKIHRYIVKCYDQQSLLHVN